MKACTGFVHYSHNRLGVTGIDDLSKVASLLLLSGSASPDKNIGPSHVVSPLISIDSRLHENLLFTFLVTQSICGFYDSKKAKGKPLFYCSLPPVRGKSSVRQSQKAKVFIKAFQQPERRGILCIDGLHRSFFPCRIILFD